MTPGAGAAADLPSAAGGFARWLLQERELRGLSREEVARSTRLGDAIVSALESGDPARMPPKAYVLGYLRTYAGAVGLDPDDVVLRWQEVAGGEGRPAARRPFPARLLLVLVAVLAVAALAGVALFGGGRGPRGPLKLERPRAVQRAPYASDPGR